MRRLATRLSTAASVGAIVALTACGGSGGGTPANPRAELTDSVQSLSDSSVLTTTIKLDTDAATLKALASSSGGSLSDSAANSITSAQFVIESKKAGSTRDADFKIEVGGTNLLDVRGVGQTLYLQGNIQAILGLFNKSSMYSQLQSQTSVMPLFVRDFLAGKWVSLNKQALTGLAGQLGANTTASGSAAEQNKVLAQLKSVLQRDVTVTRAGSDSRGDHLVLTGNTATLARDAQQAITSAVPGGSALGDRLSTTNTPSKNITVDAWVKDGALAEISIDLAQFAPPSKVPAGTKLPIVVLFSRSGSDISAPSGATPVNLTQLGALFTAVAGGSSVSGSSPSVTAIPPSPSPSP
ncbi:MAG: hypothetical protein JO222_09910 [Frankiales bacterium]|nr:hypothetical protein [Frankiales bacterium]